MTERTHDDVAQELFGEEYHRLSAWGQRSVNSAMNASKVHTMTLPEQTVSATLQDNERLARLLESAQQENLDLWNEVTELKGELADLRAELNLPSTS